MRKQQPGGGQPILGDISQTAKRDSYIWESDSYEGRKVNKSWRTTQSKRQRRNSDGEMRQTYRTLHKQPPERDWVATAQHTRVREFVVDRSHGTQVSSKTDVASQVSQLCMCSLEKERTPSHPQRPIPSHSAPHNS